MNQTAFRRFGTSWPLAWTGAVACCATMAATLAELLADYAAGK